MSEPGIVRIGNARGRIALYLDEQEAIDVAHHYGPSDGAYDELMQAVAEAYPPESDDGPRLGIRIGLRPNRYGRLSPGLEVTLDDR